MFAYSKLYFQHNSQWILRPTLSCLYLYYPCANLLRSLSSSFQVRFCDPLSGFLFLHIISMISHKLSIHLFLSPYSLLFFFNSFVFSWLNTKLLPKLLLLLLLQLAHHPIKDNGRGLSLLRPPSIPPGKAETDIAYSRELVGKGNFSIKMNFKKHPRGAALIRPSYPVRKKDGMYRPLKSLKVPPDYYYYY